MVKKSLEEVKRENIQLGFDPAVIEIAYANVDGDSSKIIQEIFRLQSESNAYPTKPGNAQEEDAALSKAIEESINEAKDKKISLEPLNPEQRVRKNGVPVGLKNIGNTCYFNSLLQTYFLNSAFVREILRYQMPEKYAKMDQKQVDKISQDDFEFKRKYASCKLVENLKNLFAMMIGSDRKYIDPSLVLGSLVDDYGNQLPVGDQKDIGEFNLIFLSRIDEGLSELYKKEKMEIQHQEGSDKENQSPSKVGAIGGAAEGDEANTDNSASHSMLKHSSISLSQGSIVSEQFIGKISNSFHNENSHFHKEEEQLFSLLFVNVKNRELYKALEEVTICQIDDYRNEKGEVVGVEKRTWIKEAPKTLFFQIDRVTFDKEQGTLQKSNEMFDFPREFYIDPFLDKNKEQALSIQKTVRKLRNQKQKYVDYLKQLQSFGEEKQNLLSILKSTLQFYQSQSNKMEVEQNNSDSPLQFPTLQSSINENHINLLNSYIEEVKKRVNSFEEKISSIEKEIEKCYEQIRTEPYHLYSILVHEGSAEMGHYYSYIYDIDSNVWRKYNDINISEESVEHVLKEAKGVNATSAYYLVYAQRDVLIPLSSSSPIRSYQMSKEEGYLKDYYSSFLTAETKDKIMGENHNMYYEIEQYKMGSYATRVVESYVKKFEVCNETFRKNKKENKKNSPPLLINLPVYMKSIDEKEYKALLMEHCIQEYGPKEYSPVFEEMLTKKMSNFNEFKKTSKFHPSSDKFFNQFMNDIYHAIAAKELFFAISESRYNKIYSLLNETMSPEAGNYFNWLGNLFSKIIVVHLLMQAETEVKNDQKEALNKLTVMIFILFKFISLEEEKQLYNNCVIWLAELCIDFTDENAKKEAERISEMVSEKKYNGEFDEYFAKETENTFQEIKGSIEISEVTWNLSRTEDVYIDAMLNARESVKGKIESANEMYREMKRVNLPLQKQDRRRITDKQGAQ